MSAALLQKLLASLVILTSIYLSFIFVVHYDLTRKINNSIFQLLPGIIFFAFGIAIGVVFKSPALIFKQVLPIKSGFVKGALSAIIFPLIGVSIQTMSVIASTSSLIDKMWFFWLKKRLFFIVRLVPLISMGIIGGNTLFKLIFATTDQAAIAKSVIKLNTIGLWTGIILGTILLLLTIMAIPHLFTRRDAYLRSAKK